MNNNIESFLEKNNVFHSLQTILLSKTTKNTLQTMLPIIKKGHALFKTTNFEIHSIKTIPMGFKGTKGTKGTKPGYNVIPSDIRYHIETKMPDKKCAKIVFSIKQRDYYLYFIHENFSQMEIKKRLKHSFIWLYLASHYANTKCSKTTHIYMYFTDLPKRLPETNGSAIDEIHANTAFTTACMPETSIYLFRDEEWFKVLIHESFHNLGLDFSGVSTEETTQSILDIFPVKSEVNLFETYCEMWAEFLNVLFVSYYNHFRSDDATILLSVENGINQERRYSVFQCAKVLHFYGMEYRNLYEKTAESHKKRTYQYKENTNVLSYYILKSIFMFYFNDFMEWCNQSSQGSLQFNVDFMKSYCDFIRDHYRQDDFLKAVDKMEKWIDDNESGDMIWRTLRMTVVEI